MTRDVSDIMHWKHGLRFEKIQLVEIETWARPDEFVRYGCRTWWGADGKVSIERLCLSPYVEKPFNSKVIKSFVPELRSRKCFCVSGFLCTLWTFYVCFTYSYMGMLQVHNYTAYLESDRVSLFTYQNVTIWWWSSLSSALSTQIRC